MIHDKIINIEHEVGYNYLNTAFTGTKSPQLSGAVAFFFPYNDQGTARKLEDFEW